MSTFSAFGGGGNIRPTGFSVSKPLTFGQPQQQLSQGIQPAQTNLLGGAAANTQFGGGNTTFNTNSISQQHSNINSLNSNPGMANKLLKIFDEQNIHFYNSSFSGPRSPIESTMAEVISAVRIAKNSVNSESAKVEEIRQNQQQSIIKSNSQAKEQNQAAANNADKPQSIEEKYKVLRESIINYDTSNCSNDKKTTVSKPIKTAGSSGTYDITKIIDERKKKQVIPRCSLRVVGKEANFAEEVYNTCNESDKIYEVLLKEESERRKQVNLERMLSEADQFERDRSERLRPIVSDGLLADFGGVSFVPPLSKIDVSDITGTVLKELKIICPTIGYLVLHNVDVRGLNFDYVVTTEPIVVDRTEYKSLVLTKTAIENRICTDFDIYVYNIFPYNNQTGQRTYNVEDLLQFRNSLMDIAKENRLEFINYSAEDCVVAFHKYLIE